MSTVPALMTAAEFQELPLDDSPYQYELHHGEVVTMSRPKSRHFKLQVRLTQLLRPTAEHLGIVELEVPFRAVPQFDFRAADVVFVSRERWDAVDPNDNLRGAPELVIEVKSESNTWAELRERASLCLANGCLDFWILDDKARTVTTIAPDGKPLLFSETECVPLRLFGSNCLPVSEIFG